MIRPIRQYLTDKHDQWLEEGAEECMHYGMTWYATWRWYGCKLLTPFLLVE